MSHVPGAVPNLKATSDAAKHTHGLDGILNNNNNNNRMDGILTALKCHFQTYRTYLCTPYCDITVNNI